MELFKPTLSESSKNLYLSKLKRLNDNNEITTLDFLKDWKSIWKKICKITENVNSQKSFLTAVSSVVADKPDFEEVHQKYKNVLVLHYFLHLYNL